MTKSSVSQSEDKNGGQPGGDQQGSDGRRSLAITFADPDVLLEVPAELLDTWGKDPFLAIKTIGFFLRVVMPVRLDDGSWVDFGTWLEIHSEDFRTAWQTWNAPEYTDLSVEGYVANKIAPWGQFPHVLVKAIVRDADEVPVLSSCSDPQVMRIIEESWSRDEVLAPYADVLRGKAKSGGRGSKRRTSAQRAKREGGEGAGPEGF